MIKAVCLLWSFWQHLQLTRDITGNKEGLVPSASAMINKLLLGIPSRTPHLPMVLWVEILLGKGLSNVDVPCYLFMVSCVSSDHWFVVPTAQWDQNAQSPGENLFHITGCVFVTVAPCNLVWKVEATWGISFRSRSSAVLLALTFLYICVSSCVWVASNVYSQRPYALYGFWLGSFERPYLIVYLVYF